MERLFALLRRYKHYLVVLSFTIIGHGLGFGREVVIAYKYGASSISDGLLIGIAPLTFYFGIFGVSYANAAMARIKTPDNNQLISRSLLPLLLVAVVVGCAFFFFNEGIVSALGPGLSGEGRLLANQIVMFSAIAAGVTSVYFWFSGIRHLERRFLRVSFSELMPNIGILIGIWFLYEWLGVIGIALGITLGYLVQLVFVFDKSRLQLQGVRFADLMSDDLKAIYRNTFYAVLGTSGMVLFLFVDRYFASQLQEGSVASINFAHKVMTLPLYTVVFAVITVMFPRLIEIRDQHTRFNQVKKKINLLLIGFSLFAAAVAIYFSHEIIALLFQYGKFDSSDVVMTAPILEVYAMGLVAQALVLFNCKVRYAKEDFKTPLVAGVVAALINLVLDIVLVDSYGAVGLAAATSIAAFANAAILLFAKQRTEPTTQESGEKGSNEPI